MKSKLFGATLLMAAGALVVPANAKIDEIRLGYVNNVQDEFGAILDGKEGENAEL